MSVKNEEIWSGVSKISLQDAEPSLVMTEFCLLCGQEIQIEYQEVKSFYPFKIIQNPAYTR